ncbi:MAG TPA: hypothetical protein O0X25_04280 [Methanocorpusculum sp.]|nr:hypothetical protein [Methanocorpusculum sp.]HJJ40470.1 hypothetical protein [Methanocorpusculum sp.]HJJ49816.1 hypothetical protein [Methanocorpusculum sp.]HJJ57347.1 hypothetical protein [Methanocorpusculum sp.]
MPFADGAVYETNQGGEMIAHTIHSVNPSLPCFPVRTTHGKAIRAEPVAALYEQGLVHHVGFFPELEEQMTEWVPGDSKSPDRLDALVWAATYLQKFRKQSSGLIMDTPVLASSPHIPYSRGHRSGVPVFFNGGRR